MFLNSAVIQNGSAVQNLTDLNFRILNLISKQNRALKYHVRIPQFHPIISCKICGGILPPAYLKPPTSWEQHRYFKNIKRFQLAHSIALDKILPLQFEATTTSL